MNKQFEFNQRNPKTKKLDTVGSMKFNSVSEDKAELFFYGDIVSNSWQSYWYEEDKCPQDIVDFLSELDGYKDLDIYINSGGGSVHAGLAIYNILQRYSGNKTVHVDGLAASIASVIALAGDKVIVPSTAQLMIHKPWSACMGNADEMRKEADALDSCQKAITAVYVANAKEGITEEQITEMVNAETWLTGEEAEQIFNIEVEQTAQIAACSSNYFDKYQNLPKLLMNEPKSSEHSQKQDNLLKEKLQTELELLSM